MDWQSKFYSIVRETEENLAKAKVKLNNQGNGLSDSQQASTFPHHALRAQNFSHSLQGQHQFHNSSPHFVSVPLVEELNMSAASGIQVLHMQEQIDAQKRTIDKLEKLVKALDHERDFYKQQISLLRGEVDGLSERMSRQMFLGGNENQITRIKQEVIQEIEKVKSMLHNQSRDFRSREAHLSLSPRVDDDLWNVRESLMGNLEHIRQDLTLMNKRIDRMESGLTSEPATSLRHTEPVFSVRDPTLNIQRTPTRLPPPTYTSVQSSGDPQLRSSIKLINAKLENLEKTMGNISFQPKSEGLFSHSAAMPYFSASPTSQTFLKLQPTIKDIDDLSSLSGLSDLSDLSDDDDVDIDDVDDNIDDIDEEIEAIIRRASGRSADDKVKSKESTSSSLYKSKSWRKGKVEFDLSDLDLSDVDAADDVDDNLEL